jgi:hypothetical protein
MISEEYENYLAGKDINDPVGFYARFLTEKGKMNGSLKGVFDKIKSQEITVEEYING